MNTKDWLNKLDEAVGRSLARLFPQLLERHVIWAFPDGKIASVSADGRFCDLYINAADLIEGADALTKDVPVAPHVGTLAVGDEVIVLRRAPRDLIVMTKKVPNASA